MEHQFDFTPEQSGALAWLGSRVVAVAGANGVVQRPQIMCKFRDGVDLKSNPVADFIAKFSANSAGYQVDPEQHTVTLTFSLKPEQLPIVVESVARALHAKRWIGNELVLPVARTVSGKTNYTLQGPPL